MIGAAITLGLIIALVTFLIIGVQKSKKKKDLEKMWSDELPDGNLPDFVETDLH
jgi:hypothetical protein